MPVPYHGKSVLQTKDPSHVPGYFGYCPQLKYHIGKTYGKATHDLLTDKNVASSHKLVLSHLYPEQAAEWDHIRDYQTSLVKGKTASFGDQKLTDPMVPGYTGFIPKGQHYFGSTFRETTFQAISDFERDRRYNESKRSPQGHSSAGNGTWKHPVPSPTYGTPLKQVAPDGSPYVSGQAFRLQGSPYKMQNSDPYKLFKSGYTGYVPRYRFLHGSGYPEHTHEALNEFTDDYKFMKRMKTMPVKLERERFISHKGNPIYPSNSGLVPKYTGYVPQEKYGFGHTYGKSTQNVLKAFSGGDHLVKVEATHA